MERRVFLIEAGRAFPVIAGALYFVRCGSSSTAPSAIVDVLGLSTTVNGHYHTANVPASDQLHPADTTYTSSTSVGHNHMVTLSADQLGTIASGGSVTVTSTVSDVTGSHQHDFTFNGHRPGGY